MLNRRSSLRVVLIGLTILIVMAQLAFFGIHSQLGTVIDDLVKSSISTSMWHPVIILPIIQFILIQIVSYAFFVKWIEFMSVEVGAQLKWSEQTIYYMGIMFWLLAVSAIWALNNYYYPHSFFSVGKISVYFIIALLVVLGAATIIALASSFFHRRHFLFRNMLLAFILVALLLPVYDAVALSFSQRTMNSPIGNKPNVIVIGLDSLRPDFTSYEGKQKIHTPNIDQFLKKSVIFSENYTPLARTFPSWVSILTAKYPKHSGARSNLANPSSILKNPTLATVLQAAGYETIYATDEKRFSNITVDYGFHTVLGPRMGLNDFVLAGVPDFPLTNLMIRLPFSRWMFPYNYANRAQAITYEPEAFTHLIRLGLAKRASQKPLLLAIHLCMSHWPFSWARDQQTTNLTMAAKYRHSVEAVDHQLGQILQILKEDGLLQNSIVILLSDHGTALGLRGDRAIAEKNYVGARNQLKKISIFKLSGANRYSLDFQHDYSINTSIGQGTDILSLQQYHTLLAFQEYGMAFIPHKVIERTSLLDIAPTVLALLHLPPLPHADGISLSSLISTKKTLPILKQRPFYLETGYSMSEIETSDIAENKIIHRAIGFYEINPRNGLLSVKPSAEKLIIRDKQLGVVRGDWLLARYPLSQHKKWILTGADHLKTVITPAYFVLANLKTGQWTIGLQNDFAKQAPAQELLKQFYGFYKNDLIGA